MNANISFVEDYSPVSPVLERFGIESAVFRQAALDGIREYKRMHEFHPITLGGSSAWGWIIGEFRKNVVNHCGCWRIDKNIKIPSVINSERLLAIVISSGDQNTGIYDQSPKTKNEKGCQTEMFVDDNSIIEADEINTEPVDANQTWVFLYYVDKELKEVRLELSLPIEISSVGSSGKIKISGWKERIIFPSVPFDGDSVEVVDTSFAEESDFFEIIKKE